MTGGWAATNTIRGCITRVVAADDGHPAIVVGRTSEDEADAALALVEAALDAAEEFVNPTDYRPGAAYRREQALAAALRAVREGK